jgi:hypothetical protein
MVWPQAQRAGWYRQTEKQRRKSMYPGGQNWTARQTKRRGLLSGSSKRGIGGTGISWGPKRGIGT